VSQAATAIAGQLNTGSGKGGKGFSGAGGRKLTVDVPVIEETNEAMLQLAQDIVAALPKNLRQLFTIVSCAEDGSAGSSSGSSKGGVRVVSLQQCVASGTDLEGCLLIAGPSSAQVSLPHGCLGLPPLQQACLIYVGGQAGWRALTRRVVYGCLEPGRWLCHWG